MSTTNEIGGRQAATVRLRPHPLVAGEAQGVGPRSERLRRGQNVAVAAVGLVLALPRIIVISVVVEDLRIMLRTVPAELTKKGAW